jgi:GT2 family glycosyltransferase
MEQPANSRPRTQTEPSGGGAVEAAQTGNSLGSGTGLPQISIVVLNYNGARWLERCLNSLAAQTIFDRLEVLVADNASPDKSDVIASRIMHDWSRGRVLQHGVNLGFCEGNNRAAKQAHGQYLFFLNNDAWLEPDCLRLLLAEVVAKGAVAATPLVMNYDDESFQSLGAQGFDLFGIATARYRHQDTRAVFMPEGCSYLIRRDVFERLGGFDPEFFMFADEADLSWRLWIAGYSALAVPLARLHHRGAANVNPAGGEAVTEFRTSDTKRFYANRNGLLLLLKNAHFFLLVLVVFQICLLIAEAIAGFVLVRRWSFIRRAYLDAITACWRLRHHVAAERKRIAAFRRRGDFWMLRFLRARPNRWDELIRMRRFGLPRVAGA